MIRRFPLLHSAEELAALVNEIGFLPFFQNAIPGFSIEESTPGELWFSEGTDGPWEWKGPAIRRANCAYGSFFMGKSGYISSAWFADFANYRRDGYDFEGFYDSGFARSEDKRIMDALERCGSLLTKELKVESGLSGHDNASRFNGALTRLQMQTFLLVENFEYPTGKNGKTYGWGIARYATAEQRFGQRYLEAVYEREPEESWKRILGQLKRILPDVDEPMLARLLGRPGAPRQS